LSTQVVELRAADSMKSLSAYIGEKAGEAILWEVKRVLGIKTPEKPVWDKFADKDKFFEAYKDYKAEWREIFRAKHSICDLLKGITKEVLERNSPNNPYSAKQRTRSILESLGIDIPKAKMGDKYPFYALASDLSKDRVKQCVRVAKSVMARNTILELINGIMSRNPREDELVLANFLIQIFNMYGNIYIRRSVFKRMKRTPIRMQKMTGEQSWSDIRPRLVAENVKQRESGFFEVRFEDREWEPGLWMIKGVAPSVYEKSTWKHEDFKALNASFFCNEEWSMNRGKPVMDKDGNGWIYNPETKDMDLVLSKDEDWHFTHGADWLRSDVQMGGKVPRHPGHK